MNKQTVISARIDAETLALVDQISAAQGRSRAWFINKAVRDYIEQEVAMLAFIEEGEKSAREQPLLSQAEMAAIIARKREDLQMRKRDIAA